MPFIFWLLSQMLGYTNCLEIFYFNKNEDKIQKQRPDYNVNDLLNQQDGNH